MHVPDTCLLCSAKRITPWHYEDDECWVADCMVCATPMIVWRTHGLPDPHDEARLLSHLERVAAERYGGEGYWVDPERRRTRTTGTPTRDRPGASSTLRATCSASTRPGRLGPASDVAMTRPTCARPAFRDTMTRPHDPE